MTHGKLWHKLLEVLKGAESKSAVCPAKKYPLKNPRWPPPTAWNVFIHIFFTKHVRNLHIICFCRFFTWGIKCLVQFWDKMWRNYFNIIFCATRRQAVARIADHTASQQTSVVFEICALSVLGSRVWRFRVTWPFDFPWVISNWWSLEPSIYL